MATYAIGDVQGCFTTLERLLSRIGFDKKRDTLWLAGDLVNRGPDSLGVLRWAKGLGSSLVTVLGNHDVHLLGVASGARSLKPGDTIESVLEASDAEALLDWLARRPLFHREGNFVLVHAGLHPSWSLDEAAGYAREVEVALEGKERKKTLSSLYGKNSAAIWNPRLTGAQRLRVIVAAFTRLRVVSRDGIMDLGFSLPPSQAPKSVKPWFALYPFPAGVTVLFGHWAALGLYVSEGAVGLDTGCVWGRTLTAIRLEDRQIFQEPSELA